MALEENVMMGGVQERWKRHRMEVVQVCSRKNGTWTEESGCVTLARPSHTARQCIGCARVDVSTHRPRRPSVPRDASHDFAENPSPSNNHTRRGATLRPTRLLVLVIPRKAVHAHSMWIEKILSIRMAVETPLDATSTHLRHEDCPRGASSPSRNRAQRSVRRAIWVVDMHCGTWQRMKGNKQVGWRRLDRNVRQKNGRIRATSDVKKVTNIDEETVVICGAGIAGMASARALHMVGIPSVILERGEDESRTEGTAIALWVNAFRALDALGIGDELRAEYPNLERFKLCNQTGRVLKEFELDECDGGPHEFRGVRRSKLLQSLQKDLPKGMIHFSCPVKSAASTENGALVVLENGQSVPCRAVLGCDGVRSNVAKSLGLPPAQYAGYQAYRGVAKFDGGIPFERAVYQVWHTEGASGTRFGMYPMNSKEVYWFVCFNWPDETSQMSPKEKKADALRFVSDWGFGIADVVRNTPEENIIRSKIGDRLLLPPFQKQWGRGYISLAGDAAHPMTPNLGQGGCCALEDAVVLGRMLGGSLPGPTTMEALRAYEKERMERAAYLTLRSRVFGALLQLPLRPVTMTRDLIVSTAFKPDHFLDHTMYDCGILSKT